MKIIYSEHTMNMIKELDDDYKKRTDELLAMIESDPESFDMFLLSFDGIRNEISTVREEVIKKAVPLRIDRTGDEEFRINYNKYLEQEYADKKTS